MRTVQEQADKSVSEYQLNECHEKKLASITHLQALQYGIICTKC